MTNQKYGISDELAIKIIRKNRQIPEEELAVICSKVKEICGKGGEYPISQDTGTIRILSTAGRAK